MKIAITADLHLTTKKEHPERFNALKEILEHLRRENVPPLIIAGDLFDQIKGISLNLKNWLADLNTNTSASSSSLETMI